MPTSRASEPRIPRAQSRRPPIAESTSRSGTHESSSSHASTPAQIRTTPRALPWLARTRQSHGAERRRLSPHKSTQPNEPSDEPSDERPDESSNEPSNEPNERHEPSGISTAHGPDLGLWFILHPRISTSVHNNGFSGKFVDRSLVREFSSEMGKTAEKISSRLGFFGGLGSIFAWEGLFLSRSLFF